MKDWQERIAALRGQAEGEGAGANERLRPMLEQYQAEWDRIHKELGEKSRALLQLQTIYDQVPSLAELTQYDRRLQELRTLQATKETDLKKCNQLLISLQESEQVLTGENDFFNRTLKSFRQAQDQAPLRQGLLKQMTDHTAETKQKKSKVVTDLTQKKAEIAELDEQHRKLLEGQRRYFQTVKEYQNAYEELMRLREEE
jgi:chromosome segregation ATPase